VTGVDVSVPCVLNIGILPLLVTAFRLAESMRLKEERLKKKKKRYTAWNVSAVPLCEDRGR